MKKTTKIICGVALVAVGILYALNALELLDFTLFFDGWWTLFIIIPSIVGIINDRDKTGGIVGLLIGVFLLLCARDIIDFDLFWKLALPAVIIIIGVKLLIGAFSGGKSHEIAKQFREQGKEPRSGFAVFSSTSLSFAGEIFENAELNAVFGSVKCDLRGSVINSDCVINATAVFGGIDIFVPENVNVKIASNSIFGGTSDKRDVKSASNSYTLYINSTALFGGVDVK